MSRGNGTHFSRVKDRRGMECARFASADDGEHFCSTYHVPPWPCSLCLHRNHKWQGLSSAPLLWGRERLCHAPKATQLRLGPCPPLYNSVSQVSQNHGNHSSLLLLQTLERWLKDKIGTRPLIPLNSQRAFTEPAIPPGAACLPLFLANYASNPGPAHWVNWEPSGTAQ